MERVEEAEKQYQLALNIDPKNAAAHNNCGVLLERMGNKDEARKQYHLALEADPNHTAAHYNYGNICILFKFNVYNPR